MATKLQNTILKMLTENTGTHFLDSGGDNGRAWQRNQGLTVETLLKRPECTLELQEHKGEIWRNVTIDLFHYLTKNLELDSICNEFNKMPVADWDSSEFYGVSSEGEKFLLSHFKTESDSFNTYNWSANFSQDLQGREVVHIESGEKYVVLQVHGGADIRGGYTDAKLFKITCDYFLYESCFFDLVDYQGEFINHEGRSASESDFKKLAKKYKLKKGGSVLIDGSLGEG